LQNYPHLPPHLPTTSSFTFSLSFNFSFIFNLITGSNFNFNFTFTFTFTFIFSSTHSEPPQLRPPANLSSRRLRQPRKLHSYRAMRGQITRSTASSSLFCSTFAGHAHDSSTCCARHQLPFDVQLTLNHLCFTKTF
ncbi:unnamed protein product, partial [Protopolystoma xenopodis]